MLKALLVTAALARTANADGFGVGAMVGISTIDLDISRSTLQPRPLAGAFYQLHPDGGWSLDVGALYAWRQLKTDEQQFSFHDLEFPVTLRGWFDIEDDVRGNVFAGAAPWFHLRQRVQGSQGGPSDLDYRNYDVALLGGGGAVYRIDPWRIGLEVRGAVGLVSRAETEDGYTGTEVALYLVATGVYVP